MVKAIFKKCDYGIYGARIQNHAGDALICSAVSALGMALVGTLGNIDGLDFVNCYYGDGLVDVEIHPMLDENTQKVIDAVFNTIRIGLKQLEATYPDNVRVENA